MATTKLVSVILLATFILHSGGVNGQQSSSCNVQIEVTPSDVEGADPTAQCTLACDQEVPTILSTGIAYYNIDELRDNFGLMVKAQLSQGVITSCETVPYVSTDDLSTVDDQTRTCLAEDSSSEVTDGETETTTAAPITTTTPAPESLTLCPKDFAQIGETCYFITADEQTQGQGTKICQAMGGSGAVFEDEEELSLIASLTTEKLFLGLKRSTEETDDWVDTSGATYTVFQWGTNQPNNLDGIENCVVFRGDKDGDSYDGYCGYDKRSLCEADLQEYLVPACPEGQYQFGGSCYLVSDSDLTSDDAESYCADQGGDLAFITSQGEQDFLAGVLTESVTIGLSSIPLYTNYLDSSSGDCLQLSAGDSFAWTELDCSTAQKALCEIPNTL